MRPVVVAISLLVGVYVLAFGLIAGVVTITVLLAVNERPSFLYALVIGSVLIFVVLGALVTFSRSRDEAADGVPVRDRDEPELWALVRRLADEADTPVPDKIFVISQPDVRMTLGTKWLGLVTVTRKLQVGAPLLACMTERQLSFVLAQELGVHGNRGTRQVSIALNARVALQKTVDDLLAGNGYDRFIGEFFQWYSKIYFRVTDNLKRWQLFVADEAAAKITGSSAAESALREKRVVETAWKLFHDKHFRPAWEAGFRPTTIFDAFARLRTAPELHAHLDEVRRTPDAVTEERIAAVGALKISSTGPDRPAGTLLANNGAVMDKTLVSELMEDLGVKRKVDWAELATSAARADRLHRTRRLVRLGGGSLTTILDQLDAGEITPLLRMDLKPGNPFGGPRVRREFARGLLIEELTWLIEVELVDAGRASWETDWLGATTFHGPDLSAEIELATDDRGSTAQLREALTH